MEIRAVGVCVKHDQPQIADAVRELAKWLGERSIEVLVDADAGRWTGMASLEREQLAMRSDLLVVLGGDGTLLSVARDVHERSLPILGVNLGTLGFLTEIQRSEMIPVLARILAGDDVRIERHMRLDVRALREGVTLGSFRALNDAVISGNSLSRMIELDASADGIDVTTYHADGLIIATPTGSTAYSLSAGGPLLVPGSEALLLTPICPHSLTQRPLVLHADTVAAVTVRGSEISLTVDGQTGLELEQGDVIEVRRSAHPVEMVSSPFRNRFEILREKLRWGER